MQSEVDSHLDTVLGSGPVCVIEPHADDAMLSLGWSIAEWIAAGREVTVVTVFWPDDERAAEGASWAASVGAGWHGVGVSNTPADRAGLELPRPLLPDELRVPEVTTVWPLGLGHDEHRLTRRAAPTDALLYLDTPYQVVPQLEAQTRAALRGTTVEWWQIPEPDKWRGASHFPSQAGLFEAFETRMRFLPEILVRDAQPRSR